MKLYVLGGSESLKTIVVLSLICTGVILSTIVIPPFSGGGLTICVIENVFGIPCPGCGMTRAFLFIGHGQISKALQMNPNSLLAYVLILWLWFQSLLFLLMHKSIEFKFPNRVKQWVLVGSLIMTACGWYYNLYYNLWI